MWNFVVKRQTGGGTINTTVYNDAFTERAKEMVWCPYCLANTRISTDCPNALTGVVPSTETPVSVSSDAHSGCRGVGQQNREWTGSIDICCLFNAPGGSCCGFSHCCYAHLCSRCRYPHSLAESGEHHQTPILSAEQCWLSLPHYLRLSS